MKTFPLTIKGYYTELPILPLPSGISIAFFNLHGNPSLTEHCAKELCKELTDCEVIITAESKGLQLAHCVARELGHEFYAVARKSKKLYMQDGIDITIQSSITTGKEQKMYLHIGNGKNIRNKNIIGIFDTDNATVSDITRRFLKNYEKDGRVISAGNEIPKSFVLYFEEKLNGTVDPKICFSQLSSTSLSGRNEKK